MPFKVHYPPSGKLDSLQKDLSKRIIAMSAGGLLLIWGLFVSNGVAMSRNLTNRIMFAAFLLINALFADFIEYLCKYAMTAMSETQLKAYGHWFVTAEMVNRWVKVVLAAVGLVLLSETLIVVVTLALRLRWPNS